MREALRAGFHREQEAAARLQMAGDETEQLRHIANIDQRIGGNHHVAACSRQAAQHGVNLAMVQVSIDAAAPGLVQHAGGKIHAVEPCRIGQEGQAAQAGTAAKIEDAVAAVGGPAGADGQTVQHGRALIAQPRQMQVEALGIGVEQPGHIGIGCAGRGMAAE